MAALHTRSITFNEYWNSGHFLNICKYHNEPHYNGRKKTLRTYFIRKSLSRLIVIKTYLGKISCLEMMKANKTSQMIFLTGYYHGKEGMYFHVAQQNHQRAEWLDLKVNLRKKVKNYQNNRETIILFLSFFFNKKFISYSNSVVFVSCNVLS